MPAYAVPSLLNHIEGLSIASFVCQSLNTIVLHVGYSFLEVSVFNVVPVIVCRINLGYDNI